MFRLLTISPPDGSSVDTREISWPGKDVSDEILVTEMRLDDLWRSMREGKDTLEQFKESLATWKALHFKAIELFGGQVEQGGQKGLFREGRVKNG